MFLGVNLRGLKDFTLYTCAYDEEKDTIDLTGTARMLTGNKELEVYGFPVTYESKISAKSTSASQAESIGIDLNTASHCNSSVEPSS